MGRKRAGSKSLHAQVVDALGGRIVSGEFRPGDTFTVADVEEEFGASRSVAREAIRVMESMGLVRSRTRVGCTVQAESDWNVLAPQMIHWQLLGAAREQALGSLVELRAGVEPVAARLAARRATPAHVATMTSAAARMAQLGREGRGSDTEFLEADIVFHSTILHATHNPAYVALAPTITACLSERNAAGLTPAHPAEINLTNHCDLAAAVARRDEGAAERLARAIVTVVSDETAH